MQNESPTLVILIAVSILASLIYPVSGLPLNGTYLSPIGDVIFSTPIPDSPDSTTAYRVDTSENISSYYSSEELEKIRNNVTSEADAPAVSQQILENYGGFPSDAKVTYVATEYLEKINGSSEEIEEHYPISTNVQYARSIDGNPVVGEGGFINIELGDNGELLYLNKVWRTVTPAGNISIQPVTTAIEKLHHGEVLNPKRYPYNVNITRIRVGYYEKGRNQSQEYLEPAWLFRGTTESGDPIKYYVYARKFANFNASSTNVSTFQTIQFTDTSETTPIKWHWDFGDGTNSTKQNPVHMYRVAGNFTVNLTVWNDLGCDTESKTGYMNVTFTRPLNADFNATPRNASIGEAIQFYDASDTSPLQWFWDFGDGRNSTHRNPTHVYTASGNYTVNLTAWNTLGSDTRSIENYIRIYPDPKPVARFIMNYSGYSEPSPHTIAFNDVSTGNIINWYWDFDEGMNTSERNPVHSFYFNESRGEWFSWNRVSLTITDIYGRKSDYSTIIYTKRNVIVDFTAEPIRGRPPLTVNFTEIRDTESGIYCDFYFWDFGDGTSYQWSRWDTGGEPPTTILHEYSSPGNYTVTLYQEESDVGSFSETKTGYILVRDDLDPALADFSANITEGKAPLAVAFTDNSTNSPVNWRWDFGDDTNSTDQNPLHGYTIPGRYTVSLHVMNDDGDDTLTRTDYITVLMDLPELTIVPQEPVLPEANFTAVPVSGKEPLKVIFNDTSSGYPVSWSWDFGDGQTSLEKDPVHTYISAGIYTVTMTATNNDGSDTKTRTDYITVTSQGLPVPEFPFLGHLAMLPVLLDPGLWR